MASLDLHVRIFLHDISLVLGTLSIPGNLQAISFTRSIPLVRAWDNVQVLMVLLVPNSSHIAVSSW